MKNFKFTPFEAVLTIIVILLIALLGMIIYPVITYLVP